MSTSMTLPRIGEETESAVVLSVLVEPGAEVSKGDPVIELESDKATTEVPASASGVVREVHVKAGDEIRSGQTILTFEDGSQDEEDADEDEEDADQEGEDEADEVEDEEIEDEVEDDTDEDEEEEDDDEEIEEEDDDDDVRSRSPRDRRRRSNGAASTSVASPKVRAFARALGVEPSMVAATGEGGRVTIEDVQSHVRHRLEATDEREEPRRTKSLPDFSAFGEVRRVPMSSLRRTISEAVSEGWTIPQVTQSDRADITRLQALRERRRAEGERPVTLTAMLIAIVARVLPSFPELNASIDIESSELVLKRYIHIGVAVDTDDGLLVPVIRDADTKDLDGLAERLDALARGARARRLDREQLSGASFTITNLGGLGTTSFTPLLISPLVGLLGVGRAEVVPVHRDGAFEPVPMLPLFITYDHRAIDGAYAARFLRRVAEVIEDPLRLLERPGQG